jgi:hypothetical protein
MYSSNMLGFVFVACVFVHVGVGYEVINENGCSKVLKHEADVLVDAKKDDVSNVRMQICSETFSRTYYCPGDSICCTPGSRGSKCCPADRLNVMHNITELHMSDHKHSFSWRVNSKNFKLNL